MESVAAHAILLVETVGERVHIGFCRHGLVECGVEHAYLRDAGQNLLHGLYTCHVGRVMERSEVVAFLYLLEHLVGDKYALAEFLGAVHHAVAYGVDFVVAGDASQFGICQDVENSFHCAFVVNQAKFLDGF